MSRDWRKAKKEVGIAGWSKELWKEEKAKIAEEQENPEITGTAGVPVPCPSMPCPTTVMLANRPAIKAKLEWLYSTGKMNAAEMTESTLKQLSEFSDSKGVEIVEQFYEAGKNFSRPRFYAVPR